MSTQKVKLKDLKVDKQLTEIREIEPRTVRKYRRFYRAGDQFPPLIVEKGTNRIVSGNHRYTAMLEEFGVDHETTVEIKSYNSEADVLADFTAENLKHGYALNYITKCQLTQAMLNEGLTEDEIAGLFRLEVSQVNRMADNVVAVKIGKKVESRPVKHGFEKPEKPLTKKQYEDHKTKDRGLNVSQMAGQLSRWLENDFIAHSSKNVEALRHLKRLIEKFLEKEKVG